MPRIEHEHIVVGLELEIADLKARLAESKSEATTLGEKLARTESDREDVKLKRSFEFDAYVLIAKYLAGNYGLEELRRFAIFWAETSVAAEGRMLDKSKEEFLVQEAKIEKAWVGREIETLNANRYVGFVENCPLKLAISQHRADLPPDYFCDYCCSVAHIERYRLLGLEGHIEKVRDGCRLETFSE